jgi:lysophospholipid acyltransferase (LPLAT)-like uncharacterized protein
MANITSQVFQAVDGQPVNKAMVLRLPMRYFAPKNVDLGSWPVGSIGIPFAELSVIIAEAIDAEKEQTQQLSSESDEEEEESIEANDADDEDFEED